MKIALIDTFSNEEFENIVKTSFSIKEVGQKLGYTSSSGDLSNKIKQKIESLKISTAHFTTKTPIKRNEENIFIENSTASQRTLRDWYKKGEYTEYKCAICGQEPFWQEKELTLILDHINGINNDDRLENLRWVCPNCNQQLDTTNGKNIKTKKEKKKNFCIDCGKEISKSALRCVVCAAKQQQKVAERPTREELKNLIRTKPFTQIGSQYNVSDNTIRKWCESYSLPTKAREIKAFSDEQWKDI